MKTTKAHFPDDQWGIVSLTDGTRLAGFMRRERDTESRVAVQVDVPAVPGSPANVAVVKSANVLVARSCPRAEVISFVRRNAWPAVMRTVEQHDAEADLLPQGAD